MCIKIKIQTYCFLLISKYFDHPVNTNLSKHIDFKTNKIYTNIEQNKI